MHNKIANQNIVARVLERKKPEAWRRGARVSPHLHVVWRRHAHAFEIRRRGGGMKNIETNNIQLSSGTSNDNAKANLLTPICDNRYRREVQSACSSAAHNISAAQRTANIKKFYGEDGVVEGAGK